MITQLFGLFRSEAGKARPFHLRPSHNEKSSLLDRWITNRKLTFWLAGKALGVIDAVIVPPCPNGGIGRRAALKMRFRKECWFDPGLGYHYLKIALIYLGFLVVRPLTNFPRADLRGRMPHNGFPQSLFAV